MNRQFSVHRCFLTLLAVALAISCPSFVLGQFGDGGGSGQEPPNLNNPVTPPFGGIGGGGAGGGGAQTGEIGNIGDGTVDPSNVDIQVSDNTRNQGFVGVSAPRIQSIGFVGAASDANGPPLVADATFGGGVNGSGSTVAIGGGGASAGAFAAGQGGFGAVQSQNGFSVPRRNLRARLVPSIDPPFVAPETISERFQNSLARLPQTQNSSTQYQISITNRTATVTGFVSSEAEADKIIRQLRLQPGVYQIDNQLQTN